MVQLMVAAIILGGVYALTAMGLNLVYGTGRFMNIAHGEFMMLGAYIAFWNYRLYGISPLVSAVMAAALTATLGVLLYLGPIRYLINRGLSTQALETITLLLFFGVLIALQNTAMLLWSADPRGYSYLSQTVVILGLPVMLSRIVAFGVAILLCVAVYLFLDYTTMGQAIRAVIQDRTAAEIVGIRPTTIYLVCIILGFALTGISGVLLSMFREFSPLMGLSYTVLAFMIIILGGLGNFRGTLLASFALAFVETFGVAWTSPSLRSIITYGLFILILLIRPAGIFGKMPAVR